MYCDFLFQISARNTAANTTNTYSRSKDFTDIQPDIVKSDG
jgi:hypothetical protein